MKAFIWLVVLQFCINIGFINSQEYTYENWNAGKELIDIGMYQKDAPEAIIFTVPEDIKNGIFTAPLNYLDQLVDYLVSWTDDNYLKIKSIHDWIVCNIPYDVAAYNKGEIKVEQPWVTLRFRTAVCGGYATLFNYMVKKADFECEYVSGHTKGKSKYAIQPVGVFVRHAWNCVKINDIWYLIDTTWDAGYVNGTRFTFAYTTDYFLTDPNIFVRRHYPQGHGFLLLDNYIGIDDFRNMKI
jgi:hypothetical protein